MIKIHTCKKKHQKTPGQMSHGVPKIEVSVANKWVIAHNVLKELLTHLSLKAIFQPAVCIGPNILNDRVCCDSASPNDIVQGDGSL